MLTDSRPHGCQGVLSARGSPGRQTRGWVRTTGLLGAPHTHIHSVTRQRHSYSAHARGPLSAAGAQRQWGAVSSLVAQTQLGAFLLGSWGRGLLWGGPGLGRGSEQARLGRPGRRAAALTPGTAASTAASAPWSGWSPGSRRPGTSRPRPCKPERREVRGDLV